MKTSFPTPLTRTGLAPVLMSMRSVLLPGITCPIRQVDEAIQFPLQQAYRNDDVLIVMPGDHLDTQLSRSVGCLARLTAHQQFPDGTTLSVLRGLARVEFCDFENQSQILPNARYKILQDFYPGRPAIDRKHRRSELLTTFFRRFKGLAENDSVASLLHDEMPLGALCDLLVSSTSLNLEDSLYLLAEQNIDLRSDFVLEKLRDSLKLASQGCFNFPPNFSGN